MCCRLLSIFSCPLNYADKLWNLYVSPPTLTVTCVVVSQNSKLLGIVVQIKFFICQGGLTDIHAFILLQCYTTGSFAILSIPTLGVCMCYLLPACMWPQWRKKIQNVRLSSNSQRNLLWDCQPTSEVWFRLNGIILQRSVYNKTFPDAVKWCHDASDSKLMKKKSYTILHADLWRMVTEASL